MTPLAQLVYLKLSLILIISYIFPSKPCIIFKFLVYIICSAPQHHVKFLVYKKLVVIKSYSDCENDLI